MKQFNLIPKPRTRKEHGGSLLIGKRRTKRPLSVKTPLHLVLRSDFAYGSRSLLRHRPLIERIIFKAGRRFQIRIYEWAVVSNHIHMVVKGRNRVDLQNFFRVVAGHIAQQILRSFPILASETKRRGGAHVRFKSSGGTSRKSNIGSSSGTNNAQSAGNTSRRPPENKFWESRVYTRIVSWGREYLQVKMYVVQNALEALGLVPYKTRVKRTKVGFENSNIRKNPD